MKPEPSRVKRRNKQPFAMIPRELLLHPPIRHRHSAPDDQLLTPFEFAVFISCVQLARAELLQQRHGRALRIGAAAIETENAEADRFKADWRQTRSQRNQGAKPEVAPAPKRHTLVSDHRYWQANMKRSSMQGMPQDRSNYKPINRGRSLKLVGKDEYRKASQRLRRKPIPQVIEVVTSKSAILRQVGLRTDGDNLRRVRAALRLLTRFGNLLGYERKPDGLHLQVGGDWLEPPLGQVPIPLPIKSASALALYLFAHTVDTHQRALEKKSMRFHKLCELLNIPTKWGQATAQRALDRAVAIVNAHLDKLPLDELDDAGVKVVNQYEVEPLDDGFVRLTSVTRQYQDRGELGPARKPQVPSSPTPQKRVRFTPQALRRMQREVYF
jgi:hypothetical protein